MPSLPLFPLGTTLLPGGRLPLRVFEPRYVVLLRDLLEQPGDERGFGVVAIRRGFEVGGELDNDLHGVGCLAVLDEIAEAGDAMFVVLATGTRRFRLDGIDRGAGTPYLTGEVSWLDEPLGQQAALRGLVTRMRAVVSGYRASLGLEELDLPGDPTELSYVVAPAVGLDTGERQRILASPDTASRLSLTLRLVQREIALTSSLGVVASLPDGPSSLN